jgi:hypothetical protein
MNFITNLFFSKYKEIVYDSMLMMIDRYIKFNLYISSKKTWNAEDLTNALIDEIFIKVERLVFIVTNRDFFFIFKFWSSLYYHLWIRLQYNIVYHSQIDEQIERQNQIFESYLRSYVNYQQNDWIKWFNIIEYVYNNSLKSVLKQIFFQMMFDSKMKIWKCYSKRFQNRRLYCARSRRTRVEDETSVRSSLKADFEKSEEKLQQKKNSNWVQNKW